MYPWFDRIRVTIGIIATALPAFACTCGPPLSPCEALGNADAVFIARIDQTRPGYSPRYFVEKVYAGELTSGTVVEPEVLGGMTSCNDTFPLGTRGRYLIYGRKVGNTYRSGCGRTRRIEEATEDLPYLEQSPRSSRENLVTGTVLSQSGRSILPVAHEPVAAVQQSGKPTEVMTDDQGLFAFRNLAPGEYTFVVAAYPQEEIRSKSVRVPLRGCVTVSLWIMHPTP